MPKPVARQDQGRPNPEDVSDGTLRRFLGYNLKRAFNVIRADLTHLLEPFGLRLLSYSTLVLIVDNPGTRQSQLAAALSIERPNLVVIIDELEQRDLIVRERVPNDRRANALRATLAGRRLCDRALKANQAHEMAVLAALSSKEKAALIKALAAIEDAAGAGRAA